MKRSREISDKLYIEVDGEEIELDIYGTRVPYRPASLDGPEEGGIEDIYAMYNGQHYELTKQQEDQAYDKLCGAE